eukprot:CAMPEP_0176414922 /NCGR_PEP_ID=MMETSP0127-20121128/5527_1 /TAXON_ID=938130 /ORGANISM="Platyophrya macrostoma, Strain WH" /LENGTH=35 /DNA_ID= /DNA_START= /DNA_END= /DNA_ORIENTATION=
MPEDGGGGVRCVATVAVGTTDDFGSATTTMGDHHH